MQYDLRYVRQRRKGYPWKHRLDPVLPVGWGPDRCSRVRFLGGAVLNCWGGGAVKTASLEMADDRFVTKEPLAKFMSNCRLGYGSTQRRLEPQ